MKRYSPLPHTFITTHDLPKHIQHLGTLRCSTPHSRSTPHRIRHALLNTSLEYIQPGESICLVVSDHTRKTGINHILPILLEALKDRSVKASDITVLVATGIHRAPTDTEMQSILGEPAYAQLSNRIITHDCDNQEDLVPVGLMPDGHPVRINRRAVEADRLILTGTVTYHYHAGFGGGRKALVPGIASRDTIAYTHSLSLDPTKDRIRDGVEPGILEGNPISEAMAACAHFCEPDLIINTVLTPDGDLAGIFCGDMTTAHRAACDCAADIYGIDIPEPADLVIASAVGAPNWIQSHKALFNAGRAVNADGLIVLAAPCPEGLGNERFRHWLRKPSIAALCTELRRNPEINGQTALSTKTHAARTILVTELSAADVTALGMTRATTIPEAITLADQRLAHTGIPSPTCILMPEARYTVPHPKS